MVSVGSPSFCPPHLAGLEHGQERQLRLVDLIPMHEPPAGRGEIRGAGDEVEEGDGDLFAGDGGHGDSRFQLSGRLSACFHATTD